MFVFVRHRLLLGLCCGLLGMLPGRAAAEVWDTGEVYYAEGARQQAGGWVATKAEALSVPRWIVQLSDDEFAARRAAATRLREAGARAVEPLVQAALQGSAEQRRGARSVLAELCRSHSATEVDAVVAALQKSGVLAKKDHPLALLAADAQSAEASWHKGRFDNHYRMLLHQLHCPDDREQYGDFRSWGFWSGSSYANHQGLTPGYWVYAYPYWYVWRDADVNPPEATAGSCHQAVGKPDAWGRGTSGQAWMPDGPQSAQLTVEFESPVLPNRVWVFANAEPGALRRLETFTLSGQRQMSWQGTDPAPAHRRQAVSVLPCRCAEKVTQIRLSLEFNVDNPYPEIDAVRLEDVHGRFHWAIAAHSRVWEESGSFTPLEMAPENEPVPLR